MGGFFGGGRDDSAQREAERRRREADQRRREAEAESSRLTKEKDRLYSAKPNHDWSSHFNDALRTLATGLENEKFNNIRIRQTTYDKGFNI